MALRVLLTILGGMMALASRCSDRFRRQLARDVVVEVSSDDGAARHFLFRDRRVTSRPGRAARADCALRFATARQGFSILTSRDASNRLFDGLLDGSVRIEGRTVLFGWFQGLVAAVVPGSPRLRLPATPPGAVVAPTSSPEVSRFITREPPERELDPSWKNAVEARKKLVLTRVVRGEPPKPF
jgi:hypothetical protein